MRHPNDDSFAGRAVHHDAKNAGIFVFLGVLTIKRRVWSSIVALVLYAIDTVVLLMFHPKSAIVHVILMYVIYKGIKATKRYSALTIESETA